MDEAHVRILLVDDRPENIMAMSSLLESPDYLVVTASSGKEALRCVLKDDFALILLDVQMPEMNGFETARLIKSRDKSKHIPIIFITALSQAKENVIQGYETGAIDFIFKPFHAEALRHKVEAFVNFYRHQRTLNEQNELIKIRSAELEEMNLKLLRTAEELHQTEALARVIGETSSDTILTLDAEGRIIAANPALKAMFGISEEDAFGCLVTKLLPKCKETPEAYFTTAENGQHIVETMARHMGGHDFPVEVHRGKASLGGRSIYVYSIRDITVRRQLELERDMRFHELEHQVAERTEELQESNDSLRDILESITDGFFTVDNSWRFLYVNREAEKMLRIRQDDVIGHSMWDVLLESDSMTFRQLHQAALQGTPTHYEVYSQLTGCWLEVRVYPKKQGLSVYFTDTSVKKRMEEDLRNSQARFHKIFQASPSLISIHSTKDGRILDVNDSWTSYTGYTHEEAVMKSVDLNIKTGADDEAELWTASSDKVVHGIKISYSTRSGVVRTGLLSTERIEIQGEHCVLTVITDITERVELELEMSRLDRLHLVGEMAAGLAHEIRNPMTTVRGFLQIAKTSTQRTSGEIINLMVEELDRANTIITEFLSLAKNKTADRKAQSLNSIVEAMFPLIQAEAMLTGKAVQLQLGKAMPLYLDEKEIRQMLLNLALNGLEAMQPGGQLIIRTNTNGTESHPVILEVEDQGTGIQKEVLDKLGTPFFTTKEKGTGLGLAVCYTIAARHNAKLEVTTGPAGTVFSIRFALHPLIENFA
ncbi:PAS domain S-box protein [Paenibacillus thalictri]|uniref:histidine kinase n=1 Tax=Paenibacillus thalictri TaxID=2527873 RepID=A0A4Q9DVV9_9BACL|nr:PAS domain S-box protein [Paenibacillus thalictri]TBL79933.1 PAS domain S-box protein [Paenibacillus thalictri]